MYIILRMLLFNHVLPIRSGARCQTNCELMINPQADYIAYGSTDSKKKTKFSFNWRIEANGQEEVAGRVTERDGELTCLLLYSPQLARHVVFSKQHRCSIGLGLVGRRGVENKSALLRL